MISIILHVYVHVWSYRQCLQFFSKYFINNTNNTIKSVISICIPVLCKQMNIKIWFFVLSELKHKKLCNSVIMQFLIISTSHVIKISHKYLFTLCTVNSKRERERERERERRERERERERERATVWKEE